MHIPFDRLSSGTFPCQEELTYAPQFLAALLPKLPCPVQTFQLALVVVPGMGLFFRGEPTASDECKSFLDASPALVLHLKVFEGSHRCCAHHPSIRRASGLGRGRRRGSLAAAGKQAVLSVRRSTASILAVFVRTVLWCCRSVLKADNPFELVVTVMFLVC